MKKTYFATYHTNNGTHPMYPYEFTNKREAIRVIRSIADGETHIGGFALVRVWANDGADELVYEARIVR